MPGTLIHRQKDPNFRQGPEKFRMKRDRGPGHYYHRGKGQYSKYSSARDAKILARGHKINKIGLPKTSRILQAGDGYLPR